jgi:hypothetical protein
MSPAPPMTKNLFFFNSIGDEYMTERPVNSMVIVTRKINFYGQFEGSRGNIISS